MPMNQVGTSRTPLRPIQRIVAELPPGLPQSDWRVESDQLRASEAPRPDRWP